MKKIRLISFFGFIFLLWANIIFSQTFQWTNVSTGAVGTYGVAVDNNGNCIATGFCYGQATFSGIQLTGYGANDIFLVKYDSQGNIQWAKSAGGKSFYGDTGQNVCTDNNGNIFVTGFFSDSAHFDNYIISSSSNMNGFIAKYNPNGNCLWVNKASASSAFCQDIATDNNGNCYVIGDFYDTLYIGNTSIVSAGLKDSYFAKFDPNGNFVWVKQIASDRSVYGYSIKTDTENNIIVNGCYERTVQLDNTTLVSNDTNCIFLAKYTSDGNLLWAEAIGGSVTTLATDKLNNIYMTGYFYSEAHFGNLILTNIGNDDSFIAKCDKDGNWIWATSSGNDSPDTPTWAHGISTDDAGNAYVIGYYQGTSHFGNDSITFSGITDIFVTCYNTNGQYQWVISGGGPYIESGNSIAVNNGVILIGGGYGENTVFGNYHIPYWGAFITRIGNPTSIEEINESPKTFSLSQNYPNPFNPSTTINYSVVDNGNVKLVVYDALGRKITELVNEYKPKGNYTITFDAGKYNLASGVYFYQLVQNQNLTVKKMILTK